MQPGPNESFATTGRSRKGEPWVWLTAAGLTFGVVMALGLFLLILVKGALVLLATAHRPDGGFHRTDRSKKSPATSPRKPSAAMRKAMLHEEIQVFRGNKDLNGEAFKYIDRANILKTTPRPESLLLVERLEYGPAIVNAVALLTPAGRDRGERPANFERSLRENSRTGSNRPRSDLLVIERKKIGAISRELEALARAEKSGAVTPETAAARRAELAEGLRNTPGRGRGNPRRPRGIQLPRHHRRRPGSVFSGGKPVRRVSLEPRRLLRTASARCSTASGNSSPRIPARRTPKAASSPPSSAR